MRLLIQSPWTKAPIDLGVITAQQAVNVQSKELSAALFPGARINLKLTLTNSFELKVQRAGGKIHCNGTWSRAAEVAVGDSFTIDDFVVSVSRADKSSDLLLTVKPRPASSVKTGARLTLPMVGPSLAFWSCLLVIVVLATSLIAPFFSTVGVPLFDTKSAMSAGNMPSLHAWSPGALHTAHVTAGLENECKACHAKAFEKVSDESCLVCHENINEHVAITPLNQVHFAEVPCRSCHQDHIEPSLLVNQDAQVCLDCHARRMDWAPDAEVIGRGLLSDHPPFKVSLWHYQETGFAEGFWTLEHRVNTPDDPAKEVSNLKFPHATHLSASGVLALNDGKALECVNCHKIENSDGRVLPIEMETHCAQCHSLTYDINNPTLKLPHGNVREVIAELQSYAVQRNSYGGLNLSQRWLLKEAEHQFSDSGCGLCHEVSEQTGASLKNRWSVKPVRLASNWFSSATYNHLSHMNIPGINNESVSCIGCHAANVSHSSSDVLMPTRGLCVTCHNAERGNSAETCITCHDFHQTEGTPAFRWRLPSPKGALAAPLNAKVTP